MGKKKNKKKKKIEAQNDINQNGITNEIFSEEVDYGIDLENEDEYYFKINPDYQIEAEVHEDEVLEKEEESKVEEQEDSFDSDKVETDEQDDDSLDSDEIESEEQDDDSLDSDKVETEEQDDDSVDSDEIETEEQEDSLDSDEVETEEQEDDSLDSGEVETEEQDENSVDSGEVETEEQEDDDVSLSTTNKKYINFETRVTSSIIVILILFALACLLIIKTFGMGNKSMVTYSDQAYVFYQVCLNESDYYNGTCKQENDIYSSGISFIDVEFNYLGNYSQEMEGLKYYVSAKTRVYDKKYSDRVLYESEETLVDKTDIEPATRIKVNESTTVDYVSFSQYVSNYYTKYPLDSVVDLEVALYIEDYKHVRKVASIVIPLGVNNFRITKNSFNKKDQKIAVDVNKWNHENTIYVIVACILIITALILLFRLTCLVLKVSASKSVYEKKVESLLVKYDSLIEIARDGYESNLARERIKVDSFDELLEIRQREGN